MRRFFLMFAFYFFWSSSSFAQFNEPPQWLQEARLGIRFQVKWLMGSHHIPMISGWPYLGEAVSDEFAYVSPMYGVGATMQTEHVGIEGYFYANFGLHPRSDLKWAAREIPAIPLEVKAYRWGIQAWGYKGNIGLGLTFIEKEYLSLEQVRGYRVYGIFGSAKFIDETFWRYTLVSILGRYRFSSVHEVRGRLGIAPVAKVDMMYLLYFIGYQDPDRPNDQTPGASTGYESQVFKQAIVYGMPLSGSLSWAIQVEGVSVYLQASFMYRSYKRYTKDWQYSFAVRVGIPV